MNRFLSYFVYNLVRAENGRPDIPTARLIMYVHTSIPGELENTVACENGIHRRCALLFVFGEMSISIS